MEKCLHGQCSLDHPPCANCGFFYDLETTLGGAKVFEVVASLEVHPEFFRLVISEGEDQQAQCVVEGRDVTDKDC